MAGILGYLSILADDIGSLAGKTMATTAKSLAPSLDDIGLLFDDIATYTKLASIKSSGLLVDDLAAIANFTNETTSEILKKELEKAKSVEEFEENIKKLDTKTQQEIIEELEHIRNVAMLEAKRKAALRELPIVYKIAKGSFINKFIIIPIVLLLSYLAPWAIAPILIIGGAYLAYEGVESILEKFFHHEEHNEDNNKKEISNENFEDEKVKSAVKTDFILSFEIIVISLSLLDNSDFLTKLFVLISVGILTTIFVYGIVAFIIKLDDIGFYLQEKRSEILQKIGDGFVKAMPYIIKVIGVLGTIAMLAVGGGIIAHETHILSSFSETLKAVPLGGFFSEIILGAIVGYIVVLVVPIFSKVAKKVKLSK
jgi:predicted DNA repair protein MutK